MLTTTELRNVARRSGARDIGNVEIDVLLTHILQLFHERGVLDHLAFKGGTMLRKMVFGPRGRLSTDLDFTKSSDIDGDDLLLEIAAILHDAPYHDITFLLERDKDYRAPANEECNITANTRFGQKISDYPVITSADRPSQIGIKFHHLSIS